MDNSNCIIHRTEKHSNLSFENNFSILEKTIMINKNDLSMKKYVEEKI